MNLKEGQISKEAEINNYILSTLGKARGNVLDLDMMLRKLNEWFTTVENADVAYHYTIAF